MVEFGLLGTFEVRLDGRPVSLRPKQRALLAVLALHAGEPVSVDRLVDDLWGERPPPTANASLQNAVSLVRRALGSGVVVTRGGGYALDVKPDRVDALRFERLLADAQDAHGEQRAERLRAALALWRGGALSDLAFEPFAASEAPRLEELRLSAREQLAETELALGRHEGVLGELGALVVSSPFRERPRALLMLALYRSGRQADALEAFGAARHVLREELGLEPSPALRALQQAMLRQDPALDPPDAAPLAHLVAEERRKTVTVLFCDLVESTALAATLDPEAYRAVLRRYYRAAREVLERHGGTVEKFVGDAVLAVFGVPSNHEDDPLRAVRAAVELRARVAELNVELEQAHGIALRTRMGINTGEAIAGEPETGQSFATGYAVNVAAKLEQAAPADEILLGAATFRLVRDAVRAEAVEPLLLGGGAAPIPAFRVAELDPQAPGVARNLQARLVGRADELATLRAAFDETKAAGACRVATVIGEAGIGKSRLAAELAKSVEDDATVLLGRCVSYGEGATYLPVAEVVRALAPDRSEAGIAALLPDAADARVVARRVRELLGWTEGAPPAGEGVWAVRRLLEAVATARPALLVLEDVHWAEPTLLDLVDHLAEHAAAPLLVLCVARPDVLESRPAWEERAALHLAPLSDEESSQLLDDLAGVPVETRKRIVAIAEGNALYVEQLHAYALDAGEDALESVPPTVDALLASRLDRLPERERSVLERAAVVGREFWRGAVDDLSERSSRAELEALAVKGLVGPARSVLEGEEGLAFHHVLIRDVAYAGITKERRSKLHERAAAWIDEREPGWHEVVGYHLEQAYRLRAEVAAPESETRAIGTAAGERLGRGGISAWKRADAAAAVKLLERALALPVAPERLRGELLCELAQARRQIGDVAGSEATLAEALESGRRSGAREVELRARLDRMGIELFTHRRASCDDVLAEASAAIPELEQLGADRTLGRAWLLVGDVHAVRGRMTSWADAYAEALGYYRRAGWSPTVAVEGIAAACAHGPLPVDEGLERCRALLTETDDLASGAGIRTWQAALEAMRGEFERAHELLETAAGINAQIGRERSSVRYVRGYALLLAGRLPEAAREYAEAYRVAERHGQLAFASSHAAELACALVDLGRTSEAKRIRDRARDWAHPEDAQAAFLWRTVEAKLHAAASSLELAAELGTDALRIAETTDAVAYRAWIAAEVARIQLARGGRRSARRFLRDAEALYREKGHLAGIAAAQALRELDVAAPA